MISSSLVPIPASTHKKVAEIQSAEVKRACNAPHVLRELEHGYGVECFSECTHQDEPHGGHGGDDGRIEVLGRLSVAAGVRGGVRETGSTDLGCCMLHGYAADPSSFTLSSPLMIAALSRDSLHQKIILELTSLFSYGNCLTDQNLSRLEATHEDHGLIH